MDSLSLFVLGWLAVFLLLLGGVAWWHWFTARPTWFLAVAIGSLLVTVAAFALMLLQLPLWISWSMLALAAVAAGSALVAAGRLAR